MIYETCMTTYYISGSLPSPVLNHCLHRHVSFFFFFCIMLHHSLSCLRRVSRSLVSVYSLIDTSPFSPFQRISSIVDQTPERYLPSLFFYCFLEKSISLFGWEETDLLTLKDRCLSDSFGDFYGRDWVPVLLSEPQMS